MLHYFMQHGSPCLFRTKSIFWNFGHFDFLGDWLLIWCCCFLSVRCSIGWLKSQKKMSEIKTFCVRRCTPLIEILSRGTHWIKQLRPFIIILCIYYWAFNTWCSGMWIGLANEMRHAWKPTNWHNTWVADIKRLVRSWNGFCYAQTLNQCM